MITTIQLNQKVKEALNRMKENERETYEEIILKIIHAVEKQKRNQKELLIEGYREMAEESLKIAREFEAIEEDFDWEWQK